ncbi:hypothetical protein BCR34DRAFT_31829 [Clohesyomyces aquaticus]|uniref:Uncharacterized protein n=1 Tax=Clohesyomyces aquaticus TaxID=1231657 RepID=A0A1Y1Z8Q3_9PLEO|nr:hypothetical protein BCR34DRAFT_31829 [Clohesyomyces aquaticus]
MLACKSCAMCQEISSAILSRFGTLDKDIDSELVRTEITTCGPYCLGSDAILALDPSYFEGIRYPEMNHNDLRLPHSSPHGDAPEMEENLLQVQSVVYVVVTAPPGSSLREIIPEVDSYSPSNGAYTPSGPSMFQYGVHRLPPHPHEGPGLMQPTLGIQLRLRYGQSGSELQGIER